ncbi:hypothetical protein Tco_0665076 [Tanacetum coccineum]
MTCSVPHSYDQIKSMIEKQIQEDRGRQLAIMNLAHEFNDACTAKDDYELSPKYKINISYQQAWRGKDYGIEQIRGSPYESFETLPVFKGSIPGNKSCSCWHGWKQSDCANCFWYPAIALAVHNEFPLAFHAAYTPEEFASNMSILQAIQLDAYHKLCEAGPQRCVINRKLLVLKLAETCRAMVQDWFTTPPRRKFVGGIVAIVDPVEWIAFQPINFDSSLVPLADAIQERDMILTYTQTHQNRLHVYVSRVEISPLIVAEQRKDERNKKENQGKPSCMKAIKYDYDTNVMYGIAKVVGKLQIFVSHNLIDLSTVLIPNNGSLEESFVESMAYSANEARKTIVSKLQRELEAEATLSDQLIVLMALQEAHDEEVCLKEQMLSLMHRFADRFTNRWPEINRLMTLPDHPLIEYGRYVLGCMTVADMKKATYLKMERDELLRSMEEKRQLIKNYKEM